MYSFKRSTNTKQTQFQHLSIGGIAKKDFNCVVEVTMMLLEYSTAPSLWFIDNWGSWL